jgi:hypothetical protein
MDRGQENISIGAREDVCDAAHCRNIAIALIDRMDGLEKRPEGTKIERAVTLVML